MTVTQLNDLLGRELGRNPYNGSNFCWLFSEDLFWPAYKTGNLVRRKIMVPLVGSDQQEEIETDIPEPEYRRDRMAHKIFKQWVVCKWIPPDQLTWWQSEFPGAPWPAQGYYFPTNATLDEGKTPSLADTEHLIKCVREQTSMTLAARIADMEKDEANKEKSKESEIDSMVRNEFTAYMNPTPGKRGHFVSMPYSKFDRSEFISPEKKEKTDNVAQP